MDDKTTYRDTHIRSAWLSWTILLALIALIMLAGWLLL